MNQAQNNYSNVNKGKNDKMSSHDDFDVFLFKNVHDVILKKYLDQKRKNAEQI